MDPTDSAVVAHFILEAQLIHAPSQESRIPQATALQIRDGVATVVGGPVAWAWWLCNPF